MSEVSEIMIDDVVVQSEDIKDNVLVSDHDDSPELKNTVVEVKSYHVDDDFPKEDSEDTKDKEYDIDVVDDALVELKNAVVKGKSIDPDDDDDDNNNNDFPEIKNTRVIKTNCPGLDHDDLCKLSNTAVEEDSEDIKDKEHDSDVVDDALVEIKNNALKKHEHEQKTTDV